MAEWHSVRRLVRAVRSRAGASAVGGIVKHRIIDTPVGPVTLVVDDDGVLCGSYLAGQRHHPDPATFGERSDEVAGDAAGQLAAYFAGKRTSFDLQLAPRATEFQRRVWLALRDVPYGQTVTYGWLAEQVGSPRGSRAVGAAVGRNPISIIVPCHRAVGTSGDLTGYAGGVERKRFLLDLEGGLLPGL